MIGLANEKRKRMEYGERVDAKESVVVRGPQGAGNHYEGPRKAECRRSYSVRKDTVGSERLVSRPLKHWRSCRQW